MSFGVFLDRDGTIMEDKHFLADAEGVMLLPNAAEGLRRLRALGARLVVITNQSGVGRGYFPIEAVERVNWRLAELLAAEGVELDGVYVCPHAPEAGCDCRKPGTELFRRAASELGLDLAEAVVIGDRDPDVEAGRALSATTIRIGVDAADLLEAAELVASVRGASATS